jgi:hypothetical protein
MSDYETTIAEAIDRIVLERDRYEKALRELRLIFAERRHAYAAVMDEIAARALGEPEG